MDMSKLLESVKARKADIEARKQIGVGFLKIPSGDSRWRIFPGWRPDEPHVYSHSFGQHWFKNADGKVEAVVVCDWDTFGNPCPFDGPIRDAFRAKKDELARAGLTKEQILNDPTMKALNEMGSRRQTLVNAVQLRAEPGKPAVVEGVPGLLPFGVTLEDAFTNIFMTALNDGVNILDLEAGHDVIINKTGSGFATEYKMTLAMKPSRIDPALAGKIINIDAYITSERNKGLPKGADALNVAMAAALKISSPSATRSLIPIGAPLSALASSAVSAPATPATPVSTAPAVAAAATVLAETPEPPKAAPTAPVSSAAFGEQLDDAELESLLASIDAK